MVWTMKWATVPDPTGLSRTLPLVQSQKGDAQHSEQHAKDPKQLCAATARDPGQGRPRLLVVGQVDLGHGSPPLDLVRSLPLHAPLRISSPMQAR